MASKPGSSFPHVDSLKAAKRALDDALEEARKRPDEIDEDDEREGPVQLAWLHDRVRLWAGAKDRPDWTALARARRHRERMGRRAAKEPLSRGLGRWEFIGPNAFDAGAGWYVAGRVNAIVIDPKDPATIYAGAAGGGVWKSVDNGLTWIPLSDTWPFLEISSIAIDPTDSSVIYAGTGDFHTGGQRYCGVMKSTDGGATFVPLPVGDAAKCSIAGIVVDPTDPRIVTICGGQGKTGDVWRSTDGGATWTAVLNEFGRWSKLVITAPDRLGNRAMFVCGQSLPDQKGRIHRSLDRGATWTALSASWIAGQFNIALAPSPLDGHRLYAMANADRQIFASSDLGDTWTDITFNFPRDPGEWRQAGFNWDLACGTVGTPARDLVFGGVRRVSMWDSKGDKWVPLPHGHDDIHCLTADPANPGRRVLIGNDGGVYEQEHVAHGWDLSSRNASLGVTQCYRGSASPFNANICIVGTQDNAVASSQTDLRSWGRLSPPSGGDAIAALVNPADDKVQFIESGVLFNGISRTADRWKSGGIDITPATGTDTLDDFSKPLAMDPWGTRLYWATDHLWLRDEKTGKWSPRVGGQRLANLAVRCLTVAESDPWRVFTGSTDGQIWMGQGPDWTWTRIDRVTAPLVVSAVAVHPRDKNDILICIGGTKNPHVWRCRDTTAVPPVWENVNGVGADALPDLPGVGLVRDPVNPDTTWYVALDVGVFYTEVGGKAWRDVTVPLGLPNVQLSDLQRIGSRIYAFTFGRGVWRLSPSINPA